MKNIKLQTRGSVPSEMKNFLKEVFIGLNAEFELYLKHYPKTKDLFISEEALLLGLFNNAIVKGNNKYQTAMEFGSFNKDKFMGRIDLSVFGKNFNLIIEAKKFNYKGKEFSSTETKNMLAKPYEQLMKYYKNEYKKSNTDPYILLLVFEFIDLNKYKGYDMSDYKIEKTNDGINFYTAYQNSEAGLMIYGFTK